MAYDHYVKIDMETIKEEIQMPEKKREVVPNDKAFNMLYPFPNFVSKRVAIIILLLISIYLLINFTAVVLELIA